MTYAIIGFITFALCIMLYGAVCEPHEVGEQMFPATVLSLVIGVAWPLAYAALLVFVVVVGLVKLGRRVMRPIIDRFDR